MKDFGTEQERFWSGAFGDDYAQRNQGEHTVASNTAFWSRILARTTGVQSVLELGANIGLNLLALQRLLPDATLSGLEINQSAVAKLQSIAGVEVFPGSLLEFDAGDRTWDLTFTKGVLIHISPDALSKAYEALHRHSRRSILVAEYYNPSPVEVSYRGHQQRLFKRDFAGEMLERYPELELVDYGFVWRRDPLFPQDDITWFLLEKRGDTP